MDQSIIDFFQPRREAWLKGKTKKDMAESELREIEKECDLMFSLEEWLPKAAKRAGQMSISTHPCSFSHPSARKNKNGDVSPIIANSIQANDGYLRSGNVAVEDDALGNGAVIDVHKFLTLEMADGIRLLDHIKQDTEVAKKLLSVKSADYSELKNGFLEMTRQGSESITSSKIKQVYFPVSEGYHQLSLLTASGIIFELRHRIDKLRFSEERKEAVTCEKNHAYHSNGYKDILNITTIGYGGTKPQNISVLNNKNGGKAHLLISEPPRISRRDIQFPTSDFFGQSVNPFNFKDAFSALHKLFSRHGSNHELRTERDALYLEIVDGIIHKMWQTRLVADQQFNAERSQLDATQRIWLLSINETTRVTEDDWLADLTKTIARFIFHGYEKVLKKKAITFSDGELKHIHQIVISAQESLR